MARDNSDNIRRGVAIVLNVDGEPVKAFRGETLATVILAGNQLHFNRTGGNEFRAAFCNMGTCFECQVRVASKPTETFRWQRACMIPADDGMVVLTGLSRQLPGTHSHEN